MLIASGVRGHYFDLRIALVPHAGHTDHGLVEVLLLVDSFRGVQHRLRRALALGLRHGARVAIDRGWGCGRGVHLADSYPGHGDVKESK